MTELHLNKQFHEVALASIETELDRLWREVNERALAAGGTAVSRNMVLTLMAYAADAAQAQTALAATEELSSQHPSRTIVILPEPNEQDSGISAHVRVHYDASGATLGYGEEIVIQACGDAAHHVPGVALPLLLTGLPAFLWWGGEPPWGSTLIETLVDGSDRLIIDSCEATDPDRWLVAGADIVRRKHTRCALSDFNWTRQTPWRELTAQFFDSVTLRPYLQAVDRVTVEYAAGDEEGPTNSTQAYLYVGWLASRLGWSLPPSHRRGFGPSRQHTLHDANGRPVMVEVNARFGMQTASWYQIDRRVRVGAVAGASGGQDQFDGRGRTDGGLTAARIGHGALMSVRIHTSAERRPGTFIIARDQDLQHATTLSQVDAGVQPSHTVHLASLGETALLHSQLELLGHDSIYEDALLTAAHLVGLEARRFGA
jgi:glucose-6-phosphate dehydrogenase assembly protein OpcA